MVARWLVTAGHGLARTGGNVARVTGRLPSDLSRARAAGYDVHDGRIVSPKGIELNVALHCNLSCRACTHLSPAFKRCVTEPADVARDLAALATAYRPAFVKLLGGEPLLHPDLPAVIDAVRDSGITDWVLVCTNGLLLDRAGDDFWSRVDDVEVSAYPGREPSPEVLERAAEKAKAHDVRLQVYHHSHFREAYAEIGTTDRRLVAQVFRTCKSAHVWRCHTVHEGHFYRCPQSAFLPAILGPPDELLADAVPLHPPAGLFDRLLSALTSTEPLTACRRCLGTAGRLFVHEQVPRRQWRAPQERTTEELLDPEYLERLLLDPDADDGCVDEHVVLVPGKDAVAPVTVGGIPAAGA